MTNAAVMTKVFLWPIPARGGLARPVAFAGEDASAPSISRKGNQLAYRVSKERDAVWQLILKDERHASAPSDANLVCKRIQWQAELFAGRQQGGVRIGPHGIQRYLGV